MEGMMKGRNGPEKEEAGEETRGRMKKRKG